MQKSYYDTVEKNNNLKDKEYKVQKEELSFSTNTKKSMKAMMQRKMNLLKHRIKRHYYYYCSFAQ